MALVGWVLAAISGLRLLWGWLAHSGFGRSPIKITRYPTGLLVGHPLLAVTGLVLWLWFVDTAQVAFAWSAFAVLVVVLLMGFTMFTRWLVGHGGRHERGTGQPFPKAALAFHGAAAIATFVVVFLGATMAGHR